MTRRRTYPAYLDAPPPGRLAFRPHEAAAAIGMAPDTMEKIIAAGQITICKVGRASYILLSDLEVFLSVRRQRRRTP